MQDLVLALFLAAAPATPAAPAPAVARTFDVPDHGQLVLAVPEGWSASTEESADEPWPTLRFAPPAGKAFSVLVSPMFDPEDHLQEPVSAAVARRFAEDALARMVPNSAEKPALEELRGASGWLFTAVDPAPKPGEWSHATQGATAVGPFALVFTVLTNGKDAPARAQALELIRSARHVPAPRPGVSPLSLSFPGRRWALELNLPGFRVSPVEQTGAGGVTIFGVNDGTGLVASVFLEPAEGPGSGADACEHYLGDRSPVPYDRSTLKRGARGEVATVEYLVPEANGRPIRQKNVFACLARDGVWVELHLSKARYASADAAAFDRVLKTVKISGADASPAE